MPLSRRGFLQTAGAAGVGITVLGAADQLLAASPSGAASSHFRSSIGYGELRPDPAGLLDLPRGFSYRIISQVGDPLTDHTGRPAAGTVPSNHDGSFAFPGPMDGSILVTNHELVRGAPAPAIARASLTYDPLTSGGTTTTHVDRRNRRIAQYVSLAGTVRNCAGGHTPWGTWFTCEETEQKADGVNAAKDHGWVFEVDPDIPSRNVNPTPLTAMGRFSHEAVAIDPKRGHAYLTEDAGGPNGLLYRFTPNDKGHHHGAYRTGGRLEAMVIDDLPDLSAETFIGATHPVRWVPVPDPSAATVSTRMQFTYLDGTTTVPGPGGRATRSRKLEGIYWQRNKAYVVCSYARFGDGSAAEHDGQVWIYDPKTSTLELAVRYAVNAEGSADRPDGPDNITVTPSGGMVLAEDGEGVQHVVGVNSKGQTFFIARNALNDSEFAGPTFSKDGTTLFVNIYTPGIALAITGPWDRRGGLGSTGP